VNALKFCDAMPMATPGTAALNRRTTNLIACFGGSELSRILTYHDAPARGIAGRKQHIMGTIDQRIRQFLEEFEAEKPAIRQGTSTNFYALSRRLDSLGGQMDRSVAVNARNFLNMYCHKF